MTARTLRVLVACEYSGTVRDAFIRRGHDAISCDILPTESPGPHYQGDVRDLLSEPFDLMVAHPPCTYFSRAGQRWYYHGTLEDRAARYRALHESLDFVKTLASCDIPRIAIENPLGRLCTLWRRPDQVIQPWQFGDDEQKETGLWLKDLPPLSATEIVKPATVVVGGKTYARWHAESFLGKRGSDRAHARNKFFTGVADAMADQWPLTCEHAVWGCL